MRYARWLAILGDWAYATALRINTTFNWGRRRLGLPYWSLSAYLKHKVKNAVQFIDNYEHAVASEARRRGVDGVVCGHIHHAEIRTIDGILYCNDGDWVESCTALVEDFDGRLRIVRWAEERARRQALLPRFAPDAAGGGVAGLRIAIVSDAWRPQINGVVRTIETVAQLLRADGHDVEVFGPDRFRTLPCPTYPEIRLSLFPAARLSHMLKLFAPDAIHLVTEGPLGWAARALLPQAATSPSPRPTTRAFPNMCAPASACRSPGATPSCAASMRPRRRCWWWRSRSATSSPRAASATWCRGRAASTSQPSARSRTQETSDARPIWLYAGRVAIEKNIKAFLDLDLPGSKWVVGGGPQLKELKRRYKDVQLLRLGRHRGAVAALRRGRLLRLPQPHRHVRPGHGRGAGLRRAGRRLSGARPARRRDRAGRRRDRRGSAHRLPRRGERRSRQPAGATPRPSPGQAAPSSSSPPCAPSRAASGSR